MNIFSAEFIGPLPQSSFVTLTNPDIMDLVRIREKTDAILGVFGILQEDIVAYYKAGADLVTPDPAVPALVEAYASRWLRFLNQDISECYTLGPISYYPKGHALYINGENIHLPRNAHLLLADLFRAYPRPTKCPQFLKNTQGQGNDLSVQICKLRAVSSELRSRIHVVWGLGMYKLTLEPIATVKSAEKISDKNLLQAYVLPLMQGPRLSRYYVNNPYTRAAVYKHLSKCLKEGWVERTHHDRNSYMYFITEAGRDALKANNLQGLLELQEGLDPVQDHR